MGCLHCIPSETRGRVPLAMICVTPSVSGQAVARVDWVCVPPCISPPVRARPRQQVGSVTSLAHPSQSPQPPFRGLPRASCGYGARAASATAQIIIVCVSLLCKEATLKQTPCMTCGMKCQAEAEYIRSTLSPTAEAAVSGALDCAREHCPEGGRCVTVDARGAALQTPECV